MSTPVVLHEFGVSDPFTLAKLNENFENLVAKLGGLEDEMSQPGFWDNKEAAQSKMGEVARLKNKRSDLMVTASIAF